MTAKTDVTTTQVGHLRKLANDKGISRNRFQRWLNEEAANVLEQLKPILAFIVTITLDAVEKFVVADHFKIDTSLSAKVKIGWMGDEFKSLFLGKVEENILAASINVHRLEKDLLDKDIRVELTPEREEITLAQFFQMLARQGHGEEGALLINGYANIAYIPDANGGKLWAVSSRWDAIYDYWYVCAFSPVVHPPDRWPASCQVLSRVV